MAEGTPDPSAAGAAPPQRPVRAPARPPTEAEVLASLPRFARLAWRVISAAQSGRLGAAAWFWQRAVVEPLIWLFLLSRRLHLHGLERLACVPQATSLLVLANHRTFFDLFVVGWTLNNLPGMRRRCVFPVRANFFYEHPLGLFLNLVGAGASMFPPFFRSHRRQGANAFGLSLLHQRLRAPGNLVGFHPEGTRSRSDDPYTLLPAMPGAGELALRSRGSAAVVPVFVGGLSNSLWAELRDNLRGRRPVWVVFGAPQDLSRWPEQTRLAHHKKCADALLAQIAILGAEETALRAGQPAPSSAAGPTAAPPAQRAPAD